MLDDLLCFDLYAASRAMTGLYRPLLGQHGLTYPQYLVLVALGRRGPSAIREVGAALRLDHGTLSPLVRRLEERGLVSRERATTDGRSVTLALTATGTALLPVFDAIQCAVREAVGLSEEDVVRLQSTLRLLTQNIRPEHPNG